jgi:hypothetical protein
MYPHKFFIYRKSIIAWKRKTKHNDQSRQVASAIESLFPGREKQSIITSPEHIHSSNGTSSASIYISKPSPRDNHIPKKAEDRYKS